MNPAHEYHQLQNRRQFFQGAGLKMGGIALAQLLGQRAMAAHAATTGEMPALIASCHAGLSVCRDDAGISLVAAMPTKIGEFLAVGRPVIVNPGLQDAASMVDQADAGVVVDTSAAGLDAAATRLLELLDDEATPGRATGLAAGFFDLDAGVDRLVEAYRRMSADR